ncbi:MAG: hypothetical protein JNM68_02455 [Dinghuibacter sp.]|nr:hypothetical protein [Dinghuibacter sp.]
MFGWFKKKERGIAVTDLIFMGTPAKHRRLLAMAQQEQPPVFVCWFEETAEAVAQFFADNQVHNITVALPREAAQHRAAAYVFCEHHPSFKTEQQYFQQLALTEALVVSALDEALFTAFGGNRIISLMKSLGLEEDEPVSHAMVSASIKKAQEKTDNKLTGMEQPARSQEEWMKRNVG